MVVVDKRAQPGGEDPTKRTGKLRLAGIVARSLLYSVPVTQLSAHNNSASSSLPSATRMTNTTMASALDVDKPVSRSSPPSTSLLNGRLSPPLSHSPSQTLTSTLITEAVNRSDDDGATLDFSSKNLVDVSESSAQELAQIGRGEDELDECCILRYVCYCCYYVTSQLIFL